MYFYTAYKYMGEMHAHALINGRSSVYKKKAAKFINITGNAKKVYLTSDFNFESRFGLLVKFGTKCAKNS
jgi:hypothetical protein